IRKCITFKITKKKLTLSSGTEYMRVVGIARPEFIDQDNVIDSKYLANASIYYVDESAAKKGWLTEIIDEFSPI
ncbi:MAG: flagellar basal body L-ring protein FlgH, partial [Rhodospirillaceae bacterium]